jgi:hypothetical protein
LPADRISSALIERVDAMLHKLEKELDDVDIKIGDRWRILDRYVISNYWNHCKQWKARSNQGHMIAL